MSSVPLVMDSFLFSLFLCLVGLVCFFGVLFVPFFCIGLYFLVMRGMKNVKKQ